MQDRLMIVIDLDQKDLVMINGHKKPAAPVFFRARQTVYDMIRP